MAQPAKLEANNVKMPYFYTPTAFVIETRVARHEIFEQLLRYAHRSLVSTSSMQYPEKSNAFEAESLLNCQDPIYALAFSELISMLVLIKTIPAPTFNSQI